MSDHLNHFPFVFGLRGDEVFLLLFGANITRVWHGLGCTSVHIRSLTGKPYLWIPGCCN